MLLLKGHYNYNIHYNNIYKDIYYSYNMSQKTCETIRRGLLAVFDLTPEEEKELGEFLIKCAEQERE